MRNGWRLFVALFVCYIAVEITHAQESYGSRIDPRIVQILEEQYPGLFYPDSELVKRYNSYGFGLGKRKPFSFGLGKRSKQFSFGLGKRREQYGFGLGKRNADSKEPVEQTSDNHRSKRSVPEWEMYDSNLDFPSSEKRTRSYNFGLGKRSKSYAFGLGKRWPMDFPPARDDADFYDSLRYPQFLDLTDNFNLETKRARNPYAFGLGKRSYSFGLGKRGSYSFGLGKREANYDDSEAYEPEKRSVYKFGLGRRAYNFGLGKRSMDDATVTDGQYTSN